MREVKLYLLTYCEVSELFISRSLHHPLPRRRKEKNLTFCSSSSSSPGKPQRMRMRLRYVKFRQDGRAETHLTEVPTHGHLRCPLRDSRTG